jgi:uncharacterized damage-inducible protein DinB
MSEFPFRVIIADEQMSGRFTGHRASISAATVPRMIDGRGLAGLRPVDGDTGNDLELLTAFLNWMRESVIAKASGITDERGHAPAVPSGTSLYGMVRHLAVCETYWLEVVFLGHDRPCDFSMATTLDETGQAIIEQYRTAIRRSNDIVAACGDPTRLSRSTAGTARSLRWILAHLMQETARHAGHADIIREGIDGSTGHRI